MSRGVLCSRLGKQASPPHGRIYLWPTTTAPLEPAAPRITKQDRAATFPVPWRAWGSCVRMVRVCE